MGLSLTLKYWTYGLDFDAIEEGLPLDKSQRPDPEIMMDFLCKKSRVSFATLRANPSGMRPDIAPQTVQAAKVDNGARLQLCPTDVARELKQVLEEAPEHKFQYQLTCRRILEAMNGAYRDAERTRKRYPVNWAYMNPEDMAEESLSDGDAIEIVSEAGCIRGVVKAEDRLRRGVLSMTHMFGELLPQVEEGGANGSFTGRLTSLERYLEPINFMPRFSGIPININRLDTC